MSEFFEFILYGAMYVGIGIAGLMALIYISLTLADFLFDDEMAGTVFFIAFAITTVVLIGYLSGSQYIDGVIYGYSFCVALYIFHKISR